MNNFKNNEILWNFWDWIVYVEFIKTVNINNNFSTIPFSIYLLFATIIFIIGVCGIIFNKRSILLVMISIEIMLLGVILNFVFFSLALNDPSGQFYALIILTMAAAESAIGLGLLIVSYRVKNNINLNSFTLLKG